MRRDIFSEDPRSVSQPGAALRREGGSPPKGVADWTAPRQMSDRETWRRAGAEGLLGVCAPAELSAAPARTSSMRRSSTRRWRGCVAHGMMLSLHADICLPVSARLRDPRSRSAAWRRAPCRGTCLLGIAMTEPGRGIRPGGHRHHRASRRRHLRAERRQDVHLQRADRRSVRRRRERPIRTRVPHIPA